MPRVPPWLLAYSQWGSLTLNVTVYLWVLFHVFVWWLSRTDYPIRHPASFRTLDGFTIRFGNFVSHI
jgi:predicted MPP superfamily phosphohydrolase